MIPGTYNFEGFIDEVRIYNRALSESEIACVTSTTTNNSPRITSMPMTVAGIGYEYSYQVIVNDPDGDPVTYSLPVAPAGMTMDQVCRKVARDVAEGNKDEHKITKVNINRYLGVPKRIQKEDLKAHEVGIATGLAWTQVGGELLYIEAMLMKGKGNLVLTGSLGDVMKESAQAAVSYARSRAETLGIDPDFHAKHDIHIHVPAGAIPKDGPSTGVTIATSLISALSSTPVNKGVAMTGEITLRGRVLPIGGLKEKALAAHRAGIHRIIVPAENAKDLKHP